MEILQKIELRVLLYLLLPVLMLAGGCSGTQGFPNAVRAGDTASFAVGWMQDFSVEDISVSFDLPRGGGHVADIPAGDPAIRAAINFYPDPVSYLVVGTATGRDDSAYKLGAQYGDFVNGYTGNDPDWWQTVVFVDIPSTMAPGNYKVTLSSTSGEVSMAEDLTVLADAGGTPAAFKGEGVGPMTPFQLSSMGRAPHFAVSLSGTTIPHAVQLDLTHDALTGNEAVYVANPRGDLKGLAWSDNGTRLRVILTATTDAGPANLSGYKFYVTGGVQNVALDTSPGAFGAFDASGADVTSDMNPPDITPVGL